MTQPEVMFRKLDTLELKLKGLTEISRLGTLSSSLDNILNSIMDIVMKIMHADIGMLMLKKEDENILQVKITKGENIEDVIKYTNINMGEGIAGKVAEIGESMIFPELTGKPRFAQLENEEIDRNKYNIICVPMKIPDKTIGVIEVVTKIDKEPFSIDDVDILEAIAAQIAVLVENSSLFNMAQKEAKAMRTLFEVNEVLKATRGLQPLLDLSMRLASRFMNTEAAALMLLDEKTNELVFEVGGGEKAKEMQQIRIKVGKGIAGLVAESGEPVLIQDVEQEPRFIPEDDILTKVEAKSILAVPLKTKRGLIGVIEVVNKIDNTKFSRKDEEFFTLFANQVALAIENAKMYAEEEYTYQEEKQEPVPTTAIHDKPKLGEILMSYNLLSKSQIEQALKLQTQTGEKIGEILVRLGIVTEDAVKCALSAQLDIPYVWLKPEMVDVDAVKTLPRDMLERYLIIPIMKIDNELTLVMDDPLDTELIDNIKRITGCNVNISLGAKNNILDVISDVLGTKPAEVTEIETDKEVIGLTKDVSGEKFLYEHLEQALNIGADEVHIEPTENGLWVRYRRLGVLEERGRAPLSIHPEVVFKAKLIGGLDVLKEGVAQENEIVSRIADKSVGVTVTTMPTAFGESIFIQLSPIDKYIPDVDNIGIEEVFVHRLKEIMHRPTGVIIITGPGRSGKTTTAYSLLKEIDATKRKIVAIETCLSPYQEPNFIQIRTKDVLSTLKLAIKQEPDVIMLGQVDNDITLFALQICLTGKLVIIQQEFPTCFDVLHHIVDIAGEVIVASSLLCIIAQRMPRALCKACRGEGCEECYQSGYSGYAPIFEIFFLNEEWREFIRHGNLERVKNIAIKEGFCDLRTEAIKKIDNGLTTVEEVLSKGVVI